jgi:tetratricopeptide (TPR) repeat protein
VHARHAAHYLALAEHAEPRVTGPEQGAWLDRLEAEQDNLRAALRWLQEAGRPEAALRLATALERYWSMRGSRTEGREWLAALLAAPTPGAPPARAAALRAAGELALLERDIPAAHAHFAEGLALARAAADLRGAALALRGIGHAAAWAGAYADARSASEEALALFRRLGDAWGASYALNVVGFIALMQGDDAAARHALEESLALARGVGDRLRMANTLFHLGRIAERAGDLAAGEALAAEQLALAREVGYPSGVAMALDQQGRFAEARGDDAAAEARYGAALELVRRVGYRSHIPGLLLLLGHLARNRPAFALARARLAEAQALLAEAPLATWTWGRWITSFRLYLLGDMARAEGNHPRAAALFAESLAQRPGGEPEGTASAAFPLAGWALLAPAAAPERAARLLGAALAAGETPGECAAILRADHERTVAAVRHRLAGAADPVQVGAWIQAGRAMTLEQAIAYAQADAPTAA